MAKKPLLSLSDSNVLAIRMIKDVLSDVVYRRENNIHSNSDLWSDDTDKISVILNEINIRQIDVISSSPFGKSQRTGSSQKRVVVKVAFERTVNVADLNVATGAMVMEFWEGKCWEPNEGSVSVRFADGVVRQSGIFAFDCASEVPPL